MSYVGKIADTASNTQHLVGSTLYGTCSTDASTAAKVVTCADFDQLLTGVTIHVKFTYQYTGDVAPTLNVNNTGAKSITVGTHTSGNMTLTKKPTWNNGQVVSFTYDGTNWCMNEYFERNTDVNVTQTESTTDAEYEVVFAGSTGTTTRTEGVGKSQYFTYNPSKKAFTLGNRKSGSTVGSWSVAMGKNVTANEYYAYAEGFSTTASAYISHAEGSMTTASGSCSHSEGAGAIASGNTSHAEGTGTTANHSCQHVFGEYNIADPSTAAATARGNYVEIVGNGTSPSAKSNARTLDWSGNEWLAGGLTLNNDEILIGDRYTGGNLNGTGLFINNYYDSDWDATYDLELEHRSIYQKEENSTSGFTNTTQIFPGIIQQELSLSSGSKVTSDIRPVSISLEAYSSSSSSSPDSKIFINSSDISLSGTNNSWDGTNASLKDAISSLNSRYNIYVGRVTMSYKSSTQLTGSVKLTGHKLYDGVITMVSMSGTPYTQVTRLTQDSGSGTDTMTFSAWGSGFVSGHVLVCNVICRVEDA